MASASHPSRPPSPSSPRYTLPPSYGGVGVPSSPRVSVAHHMPLSSPRQQFSPVIKALTTLLGQVASPSSDSPPIDEERLRQLPVDEAEVVRAVNDHVMQLMQHPLTQMSKSLPNSPRRFVLTEESLGVVSRFYQSHASSIPSEHLNTVPEENELDLQTLIENIKRPTDTKHTRWWVTKVDQLLNKIIEIPWHESDEDALRQARGSLLPFLEVPDPHIKAKAFIYLIEFVRHDPISETTAYFLPAHLDALFAHFKPEIYKSLNIELQRLGAKAIATFLWALLLHSHRGTLGAQTEEMKRSLATGLEILKRMNSHNDPEISFYVAYSEAATNLIQTEKDDRAAVLERIFHIIKAGIAIGVAAANTSPGSVVEAVDVVVREVINAFEGLRWKNDDWFHNILETETLMRACLHREDLFLHVLPMIQSHKNEIAASERLLVGMVLLLEEAASTSVDPRVRLAAIKQLIHYLFVSNDQVQERVVYSLVSIQRKADPDFHNALQIILDMTEELYQLPVFSKIRRESRPIRENAGHCSQLLKFALCRFLNIRGVEERGAPLLLLAEAKKSIKPILQVLKRHPVFTSEFKREKGTTLLHLLAKNGKIALLREWREVFPNHSLNVQDEEGNTPLHLAAREGHVEVAAYLIEIRASLSIQNLKKMTPLHEGVASGELKVLQVFQEIPNLNWNEISVLGTPLNVAISYEHTELIPFIRDRGGVVENDRFGTTALETAASERKKKVVLWLLDELKRTDSTPTDLEFLAILKLTSQNTEECREIIDFFRTWMRSGRRLSLATPFAYIDHPLFSGSVKARRLHPDFQAILDQNLTILERCSLDFQDVNNSLQSLTSSHLSQESPNTKNAVDSTSSHGSTTPANILDLLDPLGQDVVFYLATRDDDAAIECVKKLKKIKTPINRFGQTPLVVALFCKNYRMLEALLEAGYPADKRCLAGYNPLHLAAYLGDERAFFLLARHAKEVTKHNRFKETPMYLLVGYAREELPHSVDYNPLIQKNFKRSVEGAIKILENTTFWTQNDFPARVDCWGNNIAHQAARAGELPVLKVLLKHYSPQCVWKTNDYGELPLSLANEPEKVAVFVDTPGIEEAIQDGQEDPNTKILAFEKRYIELSGGRRLANHFAELNMTEKLDELTKASSCFAYKRDISGETPLIAAAKQGNLAILEMFHDKNYKITGDDREGNTALHHAAAAGQKKFVERLAQLAPELLKKPNILGRLPVHLAALSSQTEVLDLLIQLQSPLGLHDTAGDHLVHMAAIGGCLGCIKKLEAADPQALLRLNDEGQTALHLASLYGREKIVNYILLKRQITEEGDLFGRTPLHLAAQGGHVRVAVLLREEGANLVAINDVEETPLHTACYYLQPEMVDFLCQWGREIFRLGSDAIARQVDGEAEPPLLELFKPDQGIKGEQTLKERIVRTLLKEGALANPRDERGATPYHRAMQGYWQLGAFLERCVREETRQKVDPEAPDKKRRRPIHYAAAYGDLKAVQYLASRRVNLIGNRELHRLFKRPLDLSPTDSLGMNPLKDAISGGHVEVVKFFLQTPRGGFGHLGPNGETVYHVLFEIDKPRPGEPDRDKKNKLTNWTINHDKILALLLAKDPHYLWEKKKDGRTILHSLAEFCRNETVINTVLMHLPQKESKKKQILYGQSRSGQTADGVATIHNNDVFLRIVRRGSFEGHRPSFQEARQEVTI